MKLKSSAESPRTLVSTADRRRVSVRATLGTTQTLLFVAVIIAGVGPIYWMAKGALSPTQELLTNPLALWPDRPQWTNLADSWSDLQIGRYLLNTVVLVGGSWFFQLAVATTGAYALSVLKPRYGRALYAAVLATLFIPGTVSLVSLYLTILDLPITGGSLIDSPLAVWLPAAAHAFNVLLIKRFFDSIPAELYEAAEIDGAGPWTIFWRIVLPMARPILVVVSVLVIMGAWKDLLWPLIAIPSSDKQPISTALARLQNTSELSLLMAGLLMTTLPPLTIFLVFQRYIVRGVGAGFTGLKG